MAAWRQGMIYKARILPERRRRLGANLPLRQCMICHALAASAGPSADADGRAIVLSGSVMLCDAKR